jgi:hypothetical protein
LEKLILENVVVIARNLNPSLFSQLWLVKQKIVNEEDFAPNCTFSQFFTQVFTPDFQLLVVPDRLQFTLTEKSKDNTEFIKEKVGTIIRNIPHTPYKAVGTNFNWFVVPDPPVDFVEFMHKLFVKQEIPIYDQFSESDARFGAYLSKDIFGARLRLDIKPVRPTDPEKYNNVNEMLQLVFNYQLDLAEGVRIIDTMLEFLDQWNQMKNYSEKLVSIVLRR